MNGTELMEETGKIEITPKERVQRLQNFAEQTEKINTMVRELSESLQDKLYAQKKDIDDKCNDDR